MPGIVGIIGSGSVESNTYALRQMIEYMMHESFYTSGTYINDKLHCWTGWVNLKDSFSDCLPIWNETNDVCLVFSGEEFSDESFINSLSAKGHHFIQDTAGYLIHLYEEIGPSFVEQLNGVFSGVLIDIRKQLIVLFNDRYGLGRIYYHENKNGFYFASEAKALLKILPELRELDITSLSETFSCGCVLQNRSLFRNVSLLPGGSLWSFLPRQTIEKRSYFDCSVLEKQPKLDDESYCINLQENFPRILSRYFRGKNKIAMSLTGGLDGRMIMAWANKFVERLPCYTFGSHYRDCTDVSIARKVSAICGQSHETIVVGTKFFSDFPLLAERAVYISDGTMDVTGAVELYINRIARQIAPLRLTGNYGSEILRGNVAFKPNKFFNKLLDPEFCRLVNSASNTFQNEFLSDRSSFIAFKQVPWHHYSRFSVESSLLTMRSPYLDNDLVRLVFQARKDLLMSKQPSFRLIMAGNKQLSRLPTDRGLQFPAIPLITKLNNLIQEFTFKAEYAYDYGMPQWLAGVDNMFSSLHIDKVFLGRHKFYHFRVWYRDELAKYVKEILLDQRSLSRPYVNSACLEAVVNSHTQGKQNYTNEIHRLLTAELMQRSLIEGIK